MSGYPGTIGYTDAGAEYIGIDTTVISGNDRSALGGDKVLVTSTADVKAGATVTWAGTTGKTNYLTSFQLDYHGATAASTVVGQIDGSSSLVGGTIPFNIPVPIGATLVPEKLIFQFSPPVAAGATGASITFTAPTFGAGAGVANATLTGYVV